MLDGMTLDASQPENALPPGSPLRSSVLARAAMLRVLFVLLGLVPLWTAVAWAVAVP